MPEHKRDTDDAGDRAAIAAVGTIAGKWLDVRWQDGTTSRFPAVWLRDNLPQARHKQDGQRLFDVADLPEPEQLSLTGARLDDAGRVALVFAPEQVAGCFAADWLRAHALEPRNQARRHLQWGNVAAQRDALLQPAAWSDIRRQDGALLAWLQRIEKYGFALLRGLEPKSGALFDVVARFGYVRETNYGRLFDVRTQADPDNLAFSDAGLGLHTDNPYRHPAPGLQLLHCLENSAQGGETLLRDGFHAAETLRAESAADFALLASTPVRFRYREKGVALEHSAPMIECDAQGAPQAIRYNGRSIAPLRMPAEQVEDFYRAWRRFGGVLRRRQDVLLFALQPGELLIMDNQRTLHGRTTFTGGARHLQGCYADMDGLLSPARWLRERQP